MLKDGPARILFAIHKYYGENGYPPSIRDIREHADYSSISGVYYQLEVLVDRGYITRVLGNARSVRLTKKGRKYIDSRLYL